MDAYLCNDARVRDSTPGARIARGAACCGTRSRGWVLNPGYKRRLAVRKTCSQHETTIHALYKYYRLYSAFTHTHGPHQSATRIVFKCDTLGYIPKQTPPISRRRRRHRLPPPPRPRKCSSRAGCSRGRSSLRDGTCSSSAAAWASIPPSLLLARHRQSHMSPQPIIFNSSNIPKGQYFCRNYRVAGRNYRVAGSQKLGASCARENYRLC